jgi:ADP-ribose pyrophosphatase YjhB (NUDIX family)
MKREYPEHPLIGVAAVIFDGASVWLARRNQEPSRGLWSLPGGLVELGEDHLDALARELREELSIAIEIGGLAGVYDKIFRDADGRVRYHYVVVDYWGWITQGRPAAASDVSEVARVPLDGLGGMELDEELMLTIRKAESAWQSLNSSIP